MTSRAHRRRWSLVAAVLQLVVLIGGSLAQDVPSTDVYLVDLEGSGDEKPVFKEPVNITNRAGYDNQPIFLPDGSGVLYTSIRGEQADIYRYDFESKTSTAVTQTPESEFSATPIEDGAAMSVVRVGGEGRQLLWRFSLAADGESPKLLDVGIEPVGYHVWGDDGDVLLFVLGEPHTLQWRDREGTLRTVASNVGRSLHRIPRSERFSFVQKGAAGWSVDSFDAKTGEIATLIGTRPEREDLAWDSEGRLWMADGSRLYRYCPACGGGWRLMVDLGRDGIGNVSRLAFSPDGQRLAFVAERSSDPASLEP
ncbi:MAG: hypothetical protein K8J08_07595 [Thermoanaerobaculia bacterium]|nr:hypothetical protein [Thermoanaerobaculia bacterium]